MGWATKREVRHLRRLWRKATAEVERNRRNGFIYLARSQEPDVVRLEKKLNDLTKEA